MGLSKTRKKKRRVPLKRKISKILVPIDGSKNSFRALDYAISIGTALNASISTIYVLDLPPVFAVIDPVSKRLESQGKKFLAKAQKHVRKSRLRFDGKILHGKTGSVIINQSKKGKHDVIIMGARGIGGISGLLVGSVSNFVVQKSKKPVVIIK